MSFILDALKKSEIERQRQALPGLIDAPIAQRPRRLPAWAIVLCGLLAINVLVLTYFLVRGGGSNAAALPTHASAAVLPAESAHDQAAPPFSPLDNTPVYAPEIPVPEAAPPVAPPAPRAATGVVQRPSRAPDPILNSDAAKNDDDELLPSISELNLTADQALPEMHLDVHVYATKPSDRFVYINMHKYREGATLQEGPKLERIRRDGVVLSYRGLRFVLPRQS